MSYDDRDQHDDYDDIDDEYPDPGRARRVCRRRRDAAASGHRHRRHRADDAAVVVAADRPRRDHRAARGIAPSSARRAPPGALDAEGTPGVRRQDPPRGRRTARSGPGQGRADGAAHRGGPRRRAAGTPGHGDRRGRLAPTEARDRGLPRPAPRIVRDPARQAPEDGPCRSPAPVDRRDRDDTTGIEEDDPTMGSSIRTAEVRSSAGRPGSAGILDRWSTSLASSS